MSTVILSSRFHVVIPKQIRESMQLKAGMPIQVLRYGERIELMPVRPIRAARGLFRGMDTAFARDDDR